ncbi:hypothetical protein C8F04DRAFT_1177010 [Mycena alexandri]|uniref:BTB domain-containing protein n=1 Tax=Mycena alexandri TaxID=1745969 RepID=A0AAD6TAL6_9AGAR|nr:hypothetical protein C8F04DRAFT_1177010 [Mycena alexandri]
MSADPETNFSLKSLGSLTRTVKVIVEGQKYKVDSYILCCDSPVLRETFHRPFEGPGEPDYSLDNVTKSELEHLLWVYYNLLLDHYSAPLDTWRDFLKLADMWKMTRAKDFALEKLMRPGRLNSKELIALCKRDDLKGYRWHAREAYIEICTRAEPLTPAEFQAFGMDAVLLIMQIRECIVANRHSADLEKPREEDIVDNVIGRPLESGLTAIDDPDL